MVNDSVITYTQPTGGSAGIYCDIVVTVPNGTSNAYSRARG